MIKRAGKSSADQKLELLILEKFSHVLPANPLSDAGMKNFNFAIIDVAANCVDAISMDARLIAQTAQEIRTFRRQSKRDRNHLPREIILQPILDVTFSPCGFQVRLS